MREWQFDVAFVCALFLLVFFSVAPYFGLEATPNPIVISGFGALLGFAFTRKDRLTRHDDGDRDE